MDTGLFEDIASTLTVRSICGPLCQDVRSGSTIAEMCGELDPRTNPNLDPFNNPSRVIDDHGRILGIIWFHNYVQLDEAEDHDMTVDEIMELIEPNQLISADTS